MPPLVNYDSPADLRRFLDERGLGTRKRYGQHFLVNGGARRKLLDALGPEPGEAVWEIGPGLGAMTAGLLERGALVRAFEVDRGFVEALELFFADAPGFTLTAGDVMKTWRAAAQDGAELLLGNLPYNIGAALLADFIEGGKFFRRMVVTVQRETAQRMLARPGDGDYSSFSVLCASAYTVSPLAVLRGASFYPVPRVDSQGVRLDLRTDLDPRAYSPLFRPLVRRLFASRRKTVQNNLRDFAAGRVSGDLQQITRESLASAGINPRSRAEDLGLDDFIALAAALGKLAPAGRGARRGPC